MVLKVISWSFMADWPLDRWVACWMIDWQVGWLSVWLDVELERRVIYSGGYAEFRIARGHMDGCSQFG